MRGSETMTLRQNGSRVHMMVQCICLSSLWSGQAADPSLRRPLAFAFEQRKKC